MHRKSIGSSSAVPQWQLTYPRCAYPESVHNLLPERRPHASVQVSGSSRRNPEALENALNSEACSGEVPAQQVEQ
eukprot:5245268-Amphidinium_carterae.1